MFPEDNKDINDTPLKRSEEGFSIEFDVNSDNASETPTPAPSQANASRDLMEEHEEVLKGGLPFDLLTTSMAERKPIKIVGIGGGGGNAAEHMFLEGVEGVSYLILNTDVQQLNDNKIPHKIVLGENVTRGLGAGDTPEIARQAAQESANKIREALRDGNTEMVFITAGMGGGTGTGAAHVVANIAKKELGLLTVAIVTIPFAFEGSHKIIKALEAVEKLKEEVDSILIVNNERLRQYNAAQKNSFTKSLYIGDTAVSKAASSISDLIINPGYINLDFNDVKKTLNNGGVAIISTGIASGEDRLKKAIDDALSSPVLNNNDITQAKRVLIAIAHAPDNDEDPTYNFQTEELDALNDFTSGMQDYKLIPGFYEDKSLKENLRVTILASGFDLSATIESANLGDPIAKSELLQRHKNQQQLINKYYEGTQSVDNFNRKLRGHLNLPFILKEEELDDDEFINALLKTPAYNRNHEELESLRKLRNPDMAGGENKASGFSGTNTIDDKPLVSNVIDFD